MTAAGFVLPGGESTSARLRAVERERAELAGAVAGWVARFHAAHEALAIDEFDGDSCPDLETTIEYAVRAYRRVCQSEAAAADQLRRIAQERTQLAVALREEKTARAATQADLTRVEGERDEARHDLAHEKFALDMATTRLAHRNEQAAHWRTQHDLARAKLVSARQELEQLPEAVRLLAYALHLRMHGERAPGGNETWSQFDRDAEAYLRRVGGAQ